MRCTTVGVPAPPVRFVSCRDRLRDVRPLHGLPAVRCRGSGEILYEFASRAVFGCTGNFMEFSG
ncbi:Uncharacterized protein pbN1_14030 [Aromatoleum bremense]|nr:Uncharacterized protein pbN1_14030 [Aromatoleum bremense]